MNFTSQICTTKEQSERLLALGVKAETADMHYPTISEDEHTIRACWEDFWDSRKAIDGYIRRRCIPAWSLHRLMEMIPSILHDLYELDFSRRGVFYADFSNGSYNFTQAFAKPDKTLYDNIIDCIEWLIKEDHFNKEYLEE